MKLLAVIFSLLVLGICAAWISGPAMNFNKLLMLIFLPKKFVELSVNNAISNELVTNSAFKDRFEKDESYRQTRTEEFRTQFSQTTQSLRKNIFNAFIFVFSISIVALVLACLLKKWVLIDFQYMSLIQILSAFLILWSLLGQLGWTIQTIDGTSLPEQINEYFYRFLNCIGIGLLFFSGFYQIIPIGTVRVAGSAEIAASTAGMIFASGGVILLLIGGFRKFWNRIIKVKNQPREPKLSVDEIRERLRIKDMELINEVYDVCKSQLANEVARRSAIDAKANNLAGMMGIYLSVLFGLKGGQFKSFLMDTGSNVSFWLYVATCLCAAVALVYALLAARARSDHRTVGEADVFNEKIIEEGLSVYKRFLAAHYWIVYQKNYSINEQKGGNLKFAYGFFLVAIILLTALTIFNVVDYKKCQGAAMADTNSRSEEKLDKTPAPSFGDLHTGSEKPEKTPAPTAGEKITEGNQ